MLDNLESSDTLSYSYGFIVLILIFFISKSKFVRRVVVCYKFKFLKENADLLFLHEHACIERETKADFLFNTNWAHLMTTRWFIFDFNHIPLNKPLVHIIAAFFIR